MLKTDCRIGIINTDFIDAVDLIACSMMLRAMFILLKKYIMRRKMMRVMTPKMIPHKRQVFLLNQ